MSSRRPVDVRVWELPAVIEWRRAIVLVAFGRADERLWISAETLFLKEAKRVINNKNHF